MSNAAYSFLPWLRRGIGGLGAAPAAGSARANVRVELDLTGERIAGGAPLSVRVTRDIELMARATLWGRPALDHTHRATRLDHQCRAQLSRAYRVLRGRFPWRYSPRGPFDGNLKLKPWLALIVLEESEFRDGKVIAGRPLPFIEVADFAALPPHAELWAWAHVHANGGYPPMTGIRFALHGRGAAKSSHQILG